MIRVHSILVVSKQQISCDIRHFMCPGERRQKKIVSTFSAILGLQPIPGDPKDNGVAAMLDDRTFCFVIQHGRHAIVFLDLQGLVANQE